MSAETKSKTITALISLGLGTIVAYQAFQFFMQGDAANDEFFRTQYLQSNKELATAMTANTEVSRQQTSALNTVAVELRDQRRTFDQLTGRIDRLLSRGWENNRAIPEKP